MGDEQTAQPDMIAIPVKEFISTTKLQTDIFIKMPSGRFIQIAHAGDSVSIERLTVYESKNVEHLYIRKEDYSRYIDKNLSIAGIIVNRNDLNGAKKNAIFAATSQAVLQEMEDLGFTSETFVHAKAITRITVELCEAKPEFRDLLEALNGTSNETLAHSVAVSVVSVMLGQACGWTQQAVLEKLALGGLLHDIGMKEIAPEIGLKPRAKMTFNELREYETHCERGVKILQSIGSVPDDVICIVLEHHETAGGQGFPKRLKSVRQHPLARVVTLANNFCELTVKNRNLPTVRSAQEAVSYIQKTQSHFYTRELMTALEMCFGKASAKKTG